MLALSIRSTKDFMGKLLAGDCFDIFLLEEASIHVAVNYEIDGLINKEFFAGSENGGSPSQGAAESGFSGSGAAGVGAVGSGGASLGAAGSGGASLGVAGYDYIPWSEAKTACYQLIKGRRTPLYFKFVMQLKPELAQKLLEQHQLSEQIENLKALVLSIRYDERGTILTTGTSYRSFSLAKEPDKVWDDALKSFLAKKEIDFEELV